MITITIIKADITDDGLRLALRAVSGGTTVEFQRTFAVTMSAAEVKADIDNAVTLLYTALTNSEWSISV